MDPGFWQLNLGCDIILNLKSRMVLQSTSVAALLAAVKWKELLLDDPPDRSGNGCSYGNLTHATLS